MTELPEFVEVNEEMAEWVNGASRDDIEPMPEWLGDWAAEIVSDVRRTEPIRLLEPGMGIHYMMEVKPSAREAIEEALDQGDPENAPHNLWDGEHSSNCDGYDEYVPFALRRDTVNDPWTGTRFDLPTLFGLLEPYSQGVQVIALAEPLQGYET